MKSQEKLLTAAVARLLSIWRTGYVSRMDATAQLHDEPSRSGEYFGEQILPWEYIDSQWDLFFASILLAISSVALANPLWPWK